MDRTHFGQHSSSQYNEELASIRSHLMEMGGLVEKQVIDALQSLLQADSELAEKVLNTDDKVDDLEKVIDEECARVLALRQPAASDLRMIIAVSKTLSDLERVGAAGLGLADGGELLAPGVGLLGGLAPEVGAADAGGLAGDGRHVVDQLLEPSGVTGGAGLASELTTVGPAGLVQTVAKLLEGASHGGVSS